MDYSKLQKSHKEVDSVGTTIGYVNGMPGKVNQGVNIAEMTLHLIDKSKRMTHIEFADVVRKDLNKFTDFIYAINIPNPVGMSGTDISAYISGTDFNVLETHIKKAVRILEERGIAKEIDTTIRNPKPRTTFIPDRAVLKNMGFNEMALGTTVIGLFDGLKIGTYKTEERSFDIRVKTNDIKNVEEAKNNPIGSYKGTAVNLDTVVKSVSEPVSMSIVRNDRMRSVFLYCNCAAGYTAGDIMSVLNNDIAKALPSGYVLVFGPPVDSMDEAVAEFAEVFLSAIVLLYLLMAAVMESWAKPFLIMFTLPLGFIGMFAASVFTGVPISMISLLGGVMMIGIVVNNAILIMDEVT